jgi:hypothetical protein
MSLHIEQSVRRAKTSWWEWAVWLEGEEVELDRVREVTYTLHPTFPQPVRTTADRASKFKLESAGWGEFMIFAGVKTIDAGDLELHHWLSFGSEHEMPEPSTTPASTPTLFLSSSAADEPFADDLQTALEQEGIKVLRPSDAPGGMPLAKWIERTAASSKAAVAVISDKKSPWLERELSVFREQKIPIVPVLIGRAQITTDRFGAEAVTAEGGGAEIASVAKRIRQSVASGEAPQPMILSTSARVVNYQEVYAAVIRKSMPPSGP